MKEKPLKNNAKCENEQGQREALLKSHPIVCPKTRMTDKAP